MGNIGVIAKKYLSENYDCAAYLSQYEQGYYDNQKGLQLIVPLEDATIDPHHHHLVIGHTGSDRIELCLRIHKTGVWAFNLAEKQYCKVADNLQQLIDQYCDNTLNI